MLFQKFPCIRWLLCPVISLALHCPTILYSLSDTQNHVKYGYTFPKYFSPPSSLYHSSEAAQSCATLCNAMGCRLPGSSIHGIFQPEYWSELPFPSPGGLPSPGVKPGLLLYHSHDFRSHDFPHHVQHMSNLLMYLSITNIYSINLYYLNFFSYSRATSV